jgi:hypothetical protein
MNNHFLFVSPFFDADVLPPLYFLDVMCKEMTSLSSEEITYPLQLRSAEAEKRVTDLLALVEADGWKQVERLPPEEQKLAKGALMFSCVAAAAEGRNMDEIRAIADDFRAATADAAAVQGRPMALFIRKYYHE